MFPFLNLPPEIREQVYHELLSSANARRLPDKDEEAASYHFDLAILRVNKAVYREAKKVFQDNVFVKITTPFAEAIGYISAEGRVPVITTKGDRFESFHLWVSIDTMDTPLNGQRYSMIVSLDDLPTFTRLWSYSNLNHEGLNAFLRIRLTLKDPHIPDRDLPQDLQNRLLRPFGVLKRLGDLMFHGAKVLPSVEEALKTEQAIPDPSPEECLESATIIKDEGNKSLQAGDYPAALQHYVEAFAAIHIMVSGRKRYIHADNYYRQECTSGSYKGQGGDYVRFVIRVKLVANIVQTYLKMKEFDEARFWGKRSILLFRSSLSNNDDGTSDDELGGDASKWSWVRESAIVAHSAVRAETGKIFYRTALASRELGYENEVENLIRAAAVYLPDDAIVQGERRVLDERKSEYEEYLRDLGAIY